MPTRLMFETGEENLDSIEQFISGPEITVAVYDDGIKKHVFMGEKIFRKKPDGKHLVR